MEYFKIGKFVSLHGLSGELLLAHSLGKKTSLKGLEAIFVEDKKDSFFPWFIESTRIKTTAEIVDGVHARRAAGQPHCCFKTAR